jgi:hypothetical protein
MFKFHRRRSKVNTVEVIKAARADVIANPQMYRFSDFRKCAVGHVYKATTGAYADEVLDVLTLGASSARS